MTNRRYGTLVLDEHVDRQVAADFRAQGFRVIEAARDRRFRGRDERDYVGQLLAANVVFVTQDRRFIDHVAVTGARHAGVVFLGAMPRDRLLGAVSLVTGMLQAILGQGRTGMRGIVMEALPGVGLRTTFADGRTHLWTLDQIELDTEEWVGRF